MDHASPRRMTDHDMSHSSTETGGHGALLSVTCAAVPCTPEDLSDSGVPFGCVARPLAELPPLDEEEAEFMPDASDLARCSACGAYINHLCGVRRKEWRCSLCATVNAFTSARYSLGPNELRELPELCDPTLELSDGQADDDAPPMCVAVVDVASAADGKYVELVRAALHALVAALPAQTLFALLVVADTVGVYLPGAPRPHVRHVPLPIGPGAAALPLADAVRLEHMFAHVGSCATRIAAAIETVGTAGAVVGAVGGAARAASGGGLGSGGEGESARAVPLFGFGGALQLLVDALGAVPSLGPLQVLAFVGSRPSYGVGALPPLPPLPPGAGAAAGCVGVGSAALATSSSACSGEVAFEIPTDDVNDDGGLAHGRGAHDGAQARAQHGAARQVYEELALEFGLLGAAVSVLALRTAPGLGLEVIRSLASRTGGVLQVIAC